MLTTVVTLAVVFLVSFVGVWQYRKFSLSKSILDHPNERSSHEIPTPRGGGLVMALAAIAGYTVLSLATGIPLNYGGGGAYEGARSSTMNAMGLTAAIGEGSGDVTSWLAQLGDMGSGTIQDSWDHNSGARNANIELINRLILLSTAFANLTNSSNAMTLGDLSGANRSTRYETGDEDDDRPVAGFCDDREGFVWDAEARACVQRIDRQADLLLETQ
ncbi:MAG: hypothetical protein LCH61_19940 [Proteobacteria bacterium]|nr:hypothetical protein [Pseudomonadota bacterium]